MSSSEIMNSKTPIQLHEAELERRAQQKSIELNTDREPSAAPEGEESTETEKQQDPFEAISEFTNKEFRTLRSSRHENEDLKKNEQQSETENKNANPSNDQLQEATESNNQTNATPFRERIPSNERNLYRRVSSKITEVHTVTPSGAVDTSDNSTATASTSSIGSDDISLKTNTERPNRLEFAGTRSRAEELRPQLDLGRNISSTTPTPPPTPSSEESEPQQSQKKEQLPEKRDILQQGRDEKSLQEGQFKRGLNSDIQKEEIENRENIADQEQKDFETKREEELKFRGDWNTPEVKKEDIRGGKLEDNNNKVNETEEKHTSLFDKIKSHLPHLHSHA
jgi:hypothetical protein